jgi:hypothetical protein
MRDLVALLEEVFRVSAMRTQASDTVGQIAQAVAGIRAHGRAPHMETPAADMARAQFRN